MASACVNDATIGWLSPRNSFARDSNPNPIARASPVSDPDFIDFEFRLHDPVAMLPADELFSGGKLVPLHFSKPASAPDPAPAPEPFKSSKKEGIIGSGSDIFAVSPKAPTCTSRWRELLRMKRQQQAATNPGSKNPNPRSSALKQFLHRRSALTDPLLQDSESELLSRLSLSSSTSSDENPRLSLNSDPKPNPDPHPILLHRNPPRPAARGRAGRSPARRAADAPPPMRCSSVDSPRMNASGKVIFEGLGRSSSGPSTFNGGGPTRNKYKGMRVINVPVPAFGFLGQKNIGGTGSRTRNQI